MKQKRVCQELSGFILLLTLVACGKTPAPITNPPAVETSLASTARALAKLTETANPFTATPSITPSATLTPTPKISLNGTSLILQKDGSALFVDHKAGIQLVIPSGWMAVRVSEDEYYQAFTSKVVLANPALNDRLIQIQDLDVDNYRLDAFDIREGHVLNGIISDISVIFQPDDTRSLEDWWRVEASAKKPFKNFKFVSAGYPKTANGTRVLLVEQTWSKDQSNMIFYRRVVFSLPSGALALDFQINKDFKDTVLPDFEQVVNSVTLLNQ